jgi:hypothetical protein
LDQVAEISRGVTTGCNEFFFLTPTNNSLGSGLVEVTNCEGWVGTLEAHTLCRAVQRVEECQRPLFEPKKLLFCPSGKLPRYAIDYIKHGERMGYNKRPTCKGRPNWWELSLDRQDRPLIGFNYNIYDTGRAYVSSVNPTYYSDSFQILSCREPEALHAYMQSTFFHFLINVNARTVFGGGKAKLQTYELKGLYCIARFTEIARVKNFRDTYGHLINREDQFILDDLEEPYRLALDQIVFDILGLSQSERETVYEAVVDLVKSRLKKATSLEG